MDLFSLFAKISLDTSEYDKGLDTAAKKLHEVGKTISDAGGFLTKAVTVPLSGFATAAGKMSMDFENAMAKVGTIADTSVVPLESLESAIIGLSNETGVASSSIAESVYNVISATGDTAGAVDLVRNATKLATAGFTDSESAMSVLTTAMNAYGLSASDATKISDSLIMTQNLGVTTVADLASNMGRAIATASAYGVNLENLEAGYVALTKSGISTAEGTTYLSSMFNELGKAGGDVSKILQEQTGMSFGQLMDGGYSLADVLGILYDSTGQSSEGFINLWSSAEAGKAANAIVNQGLQEFNTNLGTISSSMDATQSAYETMQTNSFNLNKVTNELKNAVIGLGDVLVPVIVPALTAIVEKAKEIVNWFNQLDSGTQQLILTIAGITAAVGPVLIVVGKIVSAIGTIASGIGGLIGVIGKAGTAVKGLFAILAANPIAAVIAAVAALAAGIIVLWNTNEDFRNAVGAIWEAIKGFFVGAWEVIKAAWESAGEFFGGIVNGIKGVFEGIGEFLGGLFTAAWEAVKGAWEAAVDFFSGVWEGIQGVFSVVADVLGGFFSAAWDAIKAVWDTVLGVFQGIADGIHAAFEAVTGFLGEAFSSAWDLISGVWDAAVGFFSGVWEGISGVFSSVAEWFGGIFSEAWEAVTSAWDGVTEFFSGIWEDITGVFSDVWDKFKEIGGDILEGIWNGIGDKIEWLKGKVSGVVDTIKGWFTGKSGFDEHSPSKWSETVFYRVMQGGVNGLDNGENILMREVNSISDRVKNGLKFAPVSVGVTGSYTGTYGSMGQPRQDPVSRGGDTFNFYSPKALDPVSAAREMRKAKQQMALGYV